VSRGSRATDFYLVYGTPGTDAAAFVGYPITGAVPDTSHPTTTQTGTFTVPSGFVSAQGYTVNSRGQILRQRQYQCQRGDANRDQRLQCTRPATPGRGTVAAPEFLALLAWAAKGQEGGADVLAAVPGGHGGMPLAGERGQ
jgi:hypothetical protein